MNDELVLECAHCQCLLVRSRLSLLQGKVIQHVSLLGAFACVVFHTMVSASACWRDQASAYRAKSPNIFRYLAHLHALCFIEWFLPAPVDEIRPQLTEQSH